MKKVLGGMSKIIFSVFCIAILGMLMSFTWGALGKLFPGNFMNQLWGMVMFDIAAMCWALAFVFQSKSVTQYAAAAVGFVVGFLGTLLMVAAEVILGGQTFVQNNDIGRYLVYGFIIVTVIHAALVYLHHAGAPEIHEQINVGIARGEISTEAIRQATVALDQEKASLAQTLHTDIVNNVKRDLNLPILADPRMPIIPADPAQYAPVTVPSPHKKQSWFDRMKGTLKPGTNVNEQIVVDVPKLKNDNRALRAKLEAERSQGVITDEAFRLLKAQLDMDEAQEDKPTEGNFPKE